MENSDHVNNIVIRMIYQMQRLGQPQVQYV